MSLTIRPNKLECLVLRNPFQSGLDLRARPEPTKLGHLSDAFFLGKLLVFPANVRLDWKVNASTNILAYFASSTETKEKGFYNIVTRNFKLSKDVCVCRMPSTEPPFSFSTRTALEQSATVLEPLAP